MSTIPTLRNLIGTDGPDTLIGSDGNDSIFGAPGEDSLEGAAGNDVIRGGSGIDDIRGNEGDDTIFGGGGNDSLFGDDGNDVLDGGVGNDIYYGNLGNDTLVGSISSPGAEAFAFLLEDSFTEANDNNVIENFDPTTDVIRLIDYGLETDGVVGDSDAEFAAFLERVTISAVDGGTLITGNGSGGQLGTGSEGTIFLTGISPDQLTVDQFEFVDTIDGVEIGNRGALAGQLIGGTSDNDSLVGSDGNDSIFGAPGEDSLEGAEGNDIIRGGGGIDSIRGSLGDDTIFGGSGNDSLFGDEGIDVLDGGTGNDIYYGNLGDDILIGGAGADAFAYLLEDSFTEANDNNVLENFDANADVIRLIDYGLETDGVEGITKAEFNAFLERVTIEAVDGGTLITGSGAGGQLGTGSEGTIFLSDISPEQLTVDQFEFVDTIDGVEVGNRGAIA